MKIPSNYEEFKTASSLVKKIFRLNGFDGDFIDIMNIDLSFKISNKGLKIHKNGCHIIIYDGLHCSSFNFTKIKMTLKDEFVNVKNMFVQIGYAKGIFFIEHNIYGPSDIAIKNTENNCRLKLLTYKKNGLLNRFSGPSVKRFKNNCCFYQAYYKNGRLHNPVGPAVLEYYYGKLYNVIYYLEGQPIRRENFILKLERRLKC